MCLCVFPTPPSNFWHLLSYKCTLTENFRSHKFRAQSQKAACPSPTSDAVRGQVLSCAPGGPTRVQRFQGPFLGSINLLTELREMFYWLDYHFIIKGWTQGQPDGRCASSKVRGKGMSFPVLPKSPPVHQPGSFPNQSFGFLQKLHYRVMLNSN